MRFGSLVVVSVLKPKCRKTLLACLLVHLAWQAEEGDTAKPSETTLPALLALCKAETDP